MERYLEYFYELSNIPHGSHNTKQISDYIKNFAIEHGLRYRQDEYNNVVIFKNAHPDYVNHEPVILQAHIDMVAVKAPGYDIDMTKEGLKLYEENDFLWAEGTSLGGDDGIGVAYMLTVLDGDFKTPALECIFTVDEETGMEGASMMELSDITSRRMLNLDQEEEGIMVVSCAGGAGSTIEFPIMKECCTGRTYSIVVSRLKGGHSGCDIIYQRGNAIKLLGETLCKLSQEVDFRLVEMNGGIADNAIPFECTAKIMLTDTAASPEAASKILKYNDTEYLFGTKEDPDRAVLKVMEDGIAKCNALNPSSMQTLLELLCELPNGVQSMNQNVANMVQTSLSLGIIKTEDKFVILELLLRSSVEQEKVDLIDRLNTISAKFGAVQSISGAYPGWDYVPNSVVCDAVVSVYNEMLKEGIFSKEVVVEGIHAGLEAGVFANKLKGLDCVAIGPDSFDIHTANEHLSLPSAKRNFDMLLRVLEKL